MTLAMDVSEFYTLPLTDQALLIGWLRDTTGREIENDVVAMKIDGGTLTLKLLKRDGRKILVDDFRQPIHVLESFPCAMPPVWAGVSVSAQ